MPSVGRTLLQIAQTAGGITWQEIALYNWATDNLHEVNRVLVEQYGCSAPDAANPELSPMDPPKAPELLPIFIPKPWKEDAIAASATHTIVIKKRLPATAIGITRLDKWFIPETETCDTDYQLEGLQRRASVVEMVVWASNYCEVTTKVDEGLQRYSFKALDHPVLDKRRPNNEANERLAVQVRDWHGESEAKQGAMKKRVGKTRYINVAGSPYTVMMRYRKPAKDKEAELRIEPFWPRFDSTNTVIPKSQVVEWRIKGCSRFKMGQILFYDKTDAIVYRKPLVAADVSEGKHKYNWATDPNNTVVVTQANMPYRVQIQVHTDMDDDDGVGLAAMHTEVRMFAHQDDGTHADPKDDAQSLKLAVAAVQPDALATLTVGSFKWYKRKLAEAGFHPGPTNEDETSKLFERSLRDMQFSYPAPGGPPYQRLTADGQRSANSQAVLNALPAEERKLFGDSATRADLTNANAEPILNNPTLELAVFVDDRHTYTCAPGNAPNAPMAMDNYRGGMDIGDRTKVDGKSICEPWLPIEARIALLSKGEDLDLAVLPVVTDQMRKAIGPIRVDWTFREPAQDFNAVDAGMYDDERVRTRRFVKYQAEVNETWHDGRKVQNCPEKYGGLRPVPLIGNTSSDYYKVPYGLKDESLAPWYTLADASHKNVYSLVHDDVAQPDDDFYEDSQGKAGLYLHLSRMSGDGYRFRARVSFLDPPEGATHPNWKTLELRYPKIPQAHTCDLRLWRKASLRGHVLWGPNGENHWGTLGLGGADAFNNYYKGSYIHFVMERASLGGTPDSFTVNQIINPGNAQDMNDYRGAFTSTCSWDEFTDPALITLDTQNLWPWGAQPHFGVKHIPSPSTEPSNYRSEFLTETLQDQSWRKFRERLVHVLVDNVEKKYGRLRGHLVVEFHSSANYRVQQYYCGTCNNYQCLMETDIAWDSGEGENCHITGCAGVLRGLTNVTYTCGTCGNTEDRTEFATTAPEGRDCTCPGTPAMAAGAPDPSDFQHDPGEALPWNHAGMSLGGLFVCSDDAKAETWAHEFAHHRHLEHAENTGGKKNRKMHDSKKNRVAGDLPDDDPPLRKQWDRVCVMGYVLMNPPQDLKYFCGKCMLKLRGWTVEPMPRPNGDVN